MSDRSIFTAQPDMTPQAWALELGGTRIAFESDVRALYDIVLAARHPKDGRYLSHAFMLALSKTEHQYGEDKDSIEVRFDTNSWGMRRSIADPLLAGKIIDTPRGKFAKYGTWRGSLHDCCYALTSPTFVYQQEGRESIRRVIERWSPSGDFDNDVSTRVAAVARIMARLAPVVPPDEEKGPTMPPKPPMTKKPSPNRGYAGADYIPQAVVWHISQGSEASNLSWLTNPASGASSNYLCGRTGTIYELVDPEAGPRGAAWCNGDVEQPDRTNPLIDSWVRANINPNRRTVSIECAGFTSKWRGGSLTAKQVDALVKLTAWVCGRFNIAPDRAHILRHQQINDVDKHDCPGFSVAEMDGWIARVAALVKGAQPQPAGDESSRLMAAYRALPAFLRGNETAEEFYEFGVNLEGLNAPAKKGHGLRSEYLTLWTAPGLPIYAMQPELMIQLSNEGKVTIYW